MEYVAVVIRKTTPGGGDVDVFLHVPSGVSVDPGPHELVIPSSRDVPVFFRLRFHRATESVETITAVLDGVEKAKLPVGPGYDLADVTWRARLDREGAAKAEGWVEPDYDDSSWEERKIPSLWNENGVTYLRGKILVPDFWREKEIHLRLKAVDDADVCYLNGREIGSTGGWDKVRDYTVDPSVVRFGEENVLCIAVDNPTYGGGIYRSPNTFGIGVADATVAEDEGEGAGELRLAGEIGAPLPFRKMRVEEGVLVYEDGGEVALWGVNYYPQSWYQYDNMKRLGVDMKAAIRQDLDDMLQMGVQVIRIHVFDREISDGEGNLLENEHLDLLDYLIAEGTARGIYFFFTPIAWWWGPNQNSESFSALTPKEYMYCDDGARQAQMSYLMNWLNHVNAYTGRAYKEEPAICVLEITNEPVYADYNALIDAEATYYTEPPDKVAPFRERLRKKWLDWCESKGIKPEGRFFPLFRYEILRDYLERMQGAIRRAGGRQPVAAPLFQTTGQDDLIRAIADSSCAAVTTGTYAGSFDKVSDTVNLLSFAKNKSLDPRLRDKARLVYEFDALKTMGTYMYPALSRHFRSQGVQVCCMFQYDSRSTAEWNTDWDSHYLNLFYTPGKAVSFLIGGVVFGDLPRGVRLPDEGAEQVFRNCAVSFNRNVSIYSNENTYIHSAPCRDWSPLPVPEKPTLIRGGGDSPLVSYSGTGIYVLEIDHAARMAQLTVHPDAKPVGDPWHPRHDRSAVVLEQNRHRFALRLPGIAIGGVVRKDDGASVPVVKNAFDVVPGEYVLFW
jgi:hypothetical protein